MKSNAIPSQRCRLSRKTRSVWLVTVMLFPSACSEPVVVERPKTEASQAERQVCTEITREGVFPTWAYDGQPETAANRIDTEVSVEQGIAYTAVVDAACPGYLAEGPQ